jgi:hypothetical protein
MGSKMRESYESRNFTFISRNLSIADMGITLRPNTFRSFTNGLRSTTFLPREDSSNCRFLCCWIATWAPDGWRPSLIVYEQTHNRGGAATEVAAGFTTRVQEFAARHGIEHAAVHSATLKKFATGRGEEAGDDRGRAGAVRLRGPGRR